MTADDLFQKMCELTAVVPLCYDPNIYSIKHLAEMMNQSRYMVRKCMKELEEAGLVCRTYEGGQDEDGYVHCYHGWSLTKKATETALYKRLEKEEIRKFEDFMRRTDDEILQEEVEKIGNR